MENTINESEFKKKYPDALRLSDYSKTARAYSTQKYSWLFDKIDGHLAYKYNKETRTVEYECEHIKKGRRMLIHLFN